MLYVWISLVRFSVLVLWWQRFGATCSSLKVDRFRGVACYFEVVGSGDLYVHDSEYVGHHPAWLVLHD